LMKWSAASYAYFAVMPTMCCEYGADLAGRARRSA
jgi:hypothetical protein